MISYTDSENHAARTAVTRGKIVEHWDVIQPIPETAHNDHPLL